MFVSPAVQADLLVIQRLVTALQVPPPAPPPAPSLARDTYVRSPGPGRGFPEAGPWLTFYGSARDMGDLKRIAATHRVINVDADPGAGNFTKAQIDTLKAGGRNRVLSYLNLGAAESFRDYWQRIPHDAKLGAYDGYPDEQWIDPAHPAWRKLVLDTIVPRLVAQGVDGFYLDNLELLSHQTTSAASRQAGLDLVREIRERYPNLLIVQQNGLGPATLNGRTGGKPYADLLDGVSHEEVFTTAAGNDRYQVGTDQAALTAMRAWRDRGLRPGGRPLLLATQEYVNHDGNVAAARTVAQRGRAEGFTPFVGDRSGGLQRVPAWNR